MFGPIHPDHYWKNSANNFCIHLTKSTNAVHWKHLLSSLLVFHQIFHFQFQSSGPHQPCEDAAKDSQLRVSEEGIRGEQEVRCKGTAGGEISHAPEGCDRVSRSKLSRGHQECHQCSSVCLLKRLINCIDDIRSIAPDNLYNNGMYCKVYISWSSGAKQTFQLFSTLFYMYMYSYF